MAPYMRVFLSVVSASACTGAATLAVAPDVPPAPNAPPPQETPPALPGTGQPVPPFFPARVAMQRLTSLQYTNAVRETFGLASIQGLRLPVDGDAQFASVAASQVISIREHVVQYQDAAALVVAAAASGNNFLSSCKPKSESDTCIDAVLKTAAQRLWRRDMSSEEFARYRAVVSAAGPASNQLATGLLRAVAAVLESPFFLYQTYFGIPVAGEMRRLTPSELAARLSLFLWDNLPDEALRQAAQLGQLSTPAEIGAQARRMLASPKAAQVAARLLAEGWGVSSLSVEDKDTSKYPEWSAAMVESLKREFGLLVSEAAQDGVDFRTLLTSNHTFADSNLAKIYGIPTPPTAFERVALAPARQGLMGTAAVLTLSNTHGESSAPIYRGLFVQGRMMCQAFGAPPQSVLDQAVEDEAKNPAQSNAARVEGRKQRAQCWACHQAMDTVGLSLEHHDGIGKYRTKMGAFDVDSRGSLGGESVSSAAELSTAMRKDGRFTGCLTQTLYTAATGHFPVQSESAAIEAAYQRFSSEGHQFKELLLGVVLSEGFQTTRASP
jgi:Protein of unknown function (DUF1592)/Protein of unknown function (DUF1588)/Protein of unknown function (DUF1585)/Protein of unknown function (DUF1595)/Protein of unknown function (DUF1587)